MADQVAQTTEAIIEAVKRKRGGTVSTDDEFTSKELYNAYQKALDLLQKIEQGMATEGDKRALAVAKNQLEYYKANTTAHTEIYKADEKNLVERLKVRERIYREFIKAENSYNEKVRETDTKLTFMAKQEFRKSASAKGDPLLGAFGAIYPTDKLTGMKKPAIALDSPQFVPTFRTVLDDINTQNVAPLFVYNRNGQVDIEASKALIEGDIRYGQRSIGSPDFTTIFDFVQNYNNVIANRLAFEAQREIEINDAVNLFGEAEQAFKDGDEDRAKRLLEQWDDETSHSRLKWRAAHNLGDPDDLKARVDDARMRQQSHMYAEEYVEKLRAQIMGGETHDKVRTGIAMGIADPVFRAWAADYGWDRLGRVSMNEDGTPDYSTYVAGGDDIAALFAWQRQSKRAAGNYGLKGIDTGEVLRIEFTDGTAITGKRLRRHAADPKGVIRIVTPDGAREVYPGEVERAIYLEKPAPDVTRIDRRAKRIYEREKGQYGRLEMEVMEMGDMEDRADLVQSGDGYLADAEGNFITQDALAEAQANRLVETGYHFIETDGTRTALFVANTEVPPEILAEYPQLAEQLLHVVTPTGDVYEIDENNELIKLEGEQASGVLSLAASNPKDRNYIFLEGEGGLGLFSDEDFQSALESGIPDVQMKMSGDSPEEVAALDAARDAYISEEALGLASTPGGGPFEDLQGRSVIDQYGSKGIDPEDPIPAEPAELPDEPDVETDPVLIAEDEGVDRAVDLQENYPGKTPRTTPRDTGAPGASPRREAGQESYEDRSARLEQERQTDKFIYSDNEPPDEEVKDATKDMRQRFRAGKKTERSDRSKLTGEKTAKSLQTQEQIAGAMDLDINPEVFAPATKVPEGEKTSGDPTTGGVRVDGIGQLFGPGSPFAEMMERRKKKKEERQAKKEARQAKRQKRRDARDDATTSQVNVPGATGLPTKEPGTVYPNPGDFPPPEDK